jgi:hypothetical protein
LRRNAHTTTLIIGDSNLRIVEPNHIPEDWQLAVLPEAKLDDLPPIIYIIQDALKQTPQPCHRSGHQKATNKPNTETMVQIRRQMTKKAKRTYATGISDSVFLPQYEQNKCTLINKILAGLKDLTFIAALDPGTRPPNMTQSTTPRTR